MHIAVRDIPRTWSLKKVRNLLATDIPCHFKVLYFNQDDKFKKTAFLELPDEHDHIQIMRLINRNPNIRSLGMKAIIPKYVSKAHIQAASASKVKNRATPKNKRPGAQTGPTVPTGDSIMIITHKEIMQELQSKYTRLYNLSLKSPDNKLLENIARTIYKRLKTIMETNEEASKTCFKLSGHYRKLHPHFGDFQMILSTLYQLQDEHGLPRSQLSENDLLAVNSQLYPIDNVPYDKVRSVTEKYSTRVAKKVLEHVRHLETDAHQMDTPEDAARKKIRLHLKNMAMHLPSIIKQVIQRRLTPEKAPYHRIRIYGEPFLPSKDTMVPFTRRFKAVHIQRSDRMYNLIRINIPPALFTTIMTMDGTTLDRMYNLININIPPALFTNIMTMDGTTLGGAKLVIRSADIPLYKIPSYLIGEMKGYFGMEPQSDDFEKLTRDANEELLEPYL